MESEDPCSYLYPLLPFPTSRKDFRGFIFMKKDLPPPYSLTEPLLVPCKENFKVVETTPYQWMLAFWEMQEEARKRGERYLEDRHSLGWFLFFLHQHRSKKKN